MEFGINNTSDPILSPLNDTLQLEGLNNVDVANNTELPDKDEDIISPPPLKVDEPTSLPIPIVNNNTDPIDENLESPIDTKGSTSVAPTVAPSSASSTSHPSNSPTHAPTVLKNSNSPTSSPSITIINTNSPTYRHNEILGCAPQHYKSYYGQQQLITITNSSDSILNLYTQQVLPTTFLPQAKKHDYHSSTPIVIQYFNRLPTNDEASLMFAKDGAIYPGVVTTNDIYQLIPNDTQEYIPLGHNVKGEDVLSIINKMNESAGSNNRALLDDKNERATVEEESSAVVYALEGVKQPPTIKSTSKYTIYTVSRDEDIVRDIMTSLDIDITTSLPTNKPEHLIHNKTVRSVWIEFVQKEWRYDDHGCDNDSTLTTQNTKNDVDISGSSTIISSSSPKGGAHVGGGKSGSKGGDELVNSSSRTSSPQSSNNNNTLFSSTNTMPLLLTLTVIATLVFFITKARRPGIVCGGKSREKESWETTISRRPELGDAGNNDLELSVEDDSVVDRDDDRPTEYAPPMSTFV